MIKTVENNNDFGLVAGVRNFHTTESCLKKKDYYDVLAIPRNATAKDVKKAYYAMAKKFHPDTNKSDTQSKKKFLEVSEAYEASARSLRPALTKLYCFIKLNYQFNLKLDSGSR